MKTKLDLLFRNQSLIYKYILYVVAIILIVFLLPKGGKFKYEFQKGKPWQYETLYAPFDFSVSKSVEELDAEKRAIRENQVPYYQYEETIVINALDEISSKVDQLVLQNEERKLDTLYYKKTISTIIESIYTRGVVRKSDLIYSSDNIYIVKNNKSELVTKDQVFTLQTVFEYIDSRLSALGFENQLADFQSIFIDLINPNLSLDNNLTNKDIMDKISKVSTNKGFVDKGKLIVLKGEVVESDNFSVLSSLKGEYQSTLWSEINYYFIIGGYTVLVAMVLMMLMLFLFKYRVSIFRDNTKVTFVFFNMILMVLVTSLMVKIQVDFLYVVPLCVLPIILKTFFDPRLGLYVHVLTVLILGFIVPNSFEFIFLQILAGIVTILSVRELYKRTNLFITVAQITGVYILGYIAFHIIHEGGVDSIQFTTLGLFVLNGMITLFVQPLVYIYEKTFGLVSDVSILELSDTNTPLLKEMSNVAPGTFNHSLQVANLAEAAANEIGADAMLVRVGALYHDIGKMLNPMYFTENQISSVNPHDELSPEDSAKIIIDHVVDGIELAKKHNLPDRLIDFIRTHHGQTQVYYFYKKAQELNEEVDVKNFSYPGPLPFSKETAILMMADSVEAASKSLKNPTYEEISDFVERIIDTQMAANQFSNSNITFKDILDIKKTLKKKLTNIYHLRIEYPE
jgi:putative nucleotidyltransferase with HDIG domain